jgi:hypothetical protein
MASDENASMLRNASDVTGLTSSRLSSRNFLNYSPTGTRDHPPSETKSSAKMKQLNSLYSRPPVQVDLLASVKSSGPVKSPRTSPMRDLESSNFQSKSVPLKNQSRIPISSPAGVSPRRVNGLSYVATSPRLSGKQTSPRVVAASPQPSESPRHSSPRQSSTPTHTFFQSPLLASDIVLARPLSQTLAPVLAPTLLTDVQKKSMPLQSSKGLAEPLSLLAKSPSSLSQPSDAKLTASEDDSDEEYPESDLSSEDETFVPRPRFQLPIKGFTIIC